MAQRVLVHHVRRIIRAHYTDSRCADLLRDFLHDSLEHDDLLTYLLLRLDSQAAQCA